MLGLMVLLVIAAYLVISALVVWRAARWAKNNGRRSWLWGLLAAFVMYNVVFWDLIPTMAAHKYYCSTQAGFWVYKTHEQWVEENPGVMDTLSQGEDPDPRKLAKTPLTENTERTGLTQRFFEDVTRESVFLSLGKTEEKFYDAEYNQLIARSIQFNLGSDGATFSSGGTLEQWRQAIAFYWLPTKQCSVSDEPPIDGVSPLYRDYSQFVYGFLKSGEGK